MTSFRGLATYTIPKVDVQLAATWRSDPGAEIQANDDGDECHREQRAAAARPQPLVGKHHGQPDSAGHALRASASTTSISAWRRSSASGGRATQLGIDIYNILNSDTVLTYNLAYVAPTATSPEQLADAQARIATARYVKVNFQIDF